MKRRQFLTGLAAAALAPALPPLPVAALPVVPSPAPTPGLLAFIVGTPDEFNWRVEFATSAKEAFIQRFGEDHFGEDPAYDPPLDEHVTRVPAWDNKNEKDLSAGDWIRQGFGHTCSRCEYECYEHDGASAIDGEAVCEECLTLADKFTLSANSKWSRGDFIDEIVEYIAENDEAAARKWLQKEKVWDQVEHDHWPEAVALAAQYA